MRIAALLLGSATLILLVGGYLQLARALRPEVAPFVEAEASGEFLIELTPTFAAAPSLFAGLAPLSGELRLQGRSLWSSSEPLEAGRSIQVAKPEGFIVGENELWCAMYTSDAVPGDEFDRWDASSAVGSDDFPAAETLGQRRGLRVRVFQDNRLLVDQTLWSVAGGVPAGLVQVVVPSGDVEQAHDVHL